MHSLAALGSSRKKPNSPPTTSPKKGLEFPESGGGGGGEQILFCGGGTSINIYFLELHIAWQKSQKWTELNLCMIWFHSKSLHQKQSWVVSHLR